MRLNTQRFQWESGANGQNAAPLILLGDERNSGGGIVEITLNWDSAGRVTARVRNWMPVPNSLTPSLVEDQTIIGAMDGTTFTFAPVHISIGINDGPQDTAPQTVTGILHPPTFAVAVSEPNPPAGYAPGWSGYGLTLIISDQATVDKDAREMAEYCSVPNSGLPPVAPFCFT